MTLLATFGHLWESKWNPIRNYQTVSLETVWKFRITPKLAPPCIDKKGKEVCLAAARAQKVRSRPHPHFFKTVSPGKSVNQVYRRKVGGRCIPLRTNKDASKSEAAKANAPATTLVVVGGPSSSPLEGSKAPLYFG
jgi:hypothetical protein